MPKSDEPPPEGPEVKRCSEVIRDSLEGKTLTKIELVSGKLARQGIKDLDKIQFPVKVERVSTKGKLILIELEGDYHIISTLGTSGWWYPDLNTIDKSTMDEAYYAKVVDTITKAQKHTRVLLHSSDGQRVHYVDPRNFGNFYVLDDEHFCKKIDEIGIDILSPRPFIHINRHAMWAKEKFFKKKYSNKRLAEILLDQSVMAGLGNIYRAETMYLSGISPHRLGKDITEDEFGKIFRAAWNVLILAYDGRGSMLYPIDLIKRTLGVKGIPDDVTYINGHLVYGMRRDIFGNVVVGETIGTRTCWWVPAVQT